MTLEVALRHRFPGFALDATFEAPSGVTALFGRSGAGKSTVVAAVAGLMRPEHGRVVAGGRVLLDTAAGVEVACHRRRLGLVFQEPRLFPHLSVRRNLGFGAWFAPRLAQAARRAEFDRTVAMLGIEPLLQRMPHRLSGGEQARVAIGRALLARPAMLLMDEPLASLDDARKAEILPWIERLRDEAGVPILYVSHALAEIARLATTIVALDAGRVARAGPAAEVLADPDSFPLMGRQEAGAILAARVVAHEADGLTRLDVAAGPVLVPRVEAPAGATLRLRIRARDIILAQAPPQGISALNALPVTVTRVAASDGAMVEVGLDAAGERLLARITQRSAAQMGLAPGLGCYAVVKAIAVGRRDLGAASGPQPAAGATAAPPPERGSDTGTTEL
ncbi:MAG: molybdenum ABC transporter ATP-binding protein [Pseudomonadota bacterium]